MSRDISITAKNYRCFTEEEPLSLSLSNGYTSFVGCNNTGKTTILRFFYEVRPILVALMSNNNPVEVLKQGRGLSINWNGFETNPNEMMNTDNEDDMTVVIEVPYDYEDQSIPVISKLKLTVHRDDRAFDKFVAGFYSSDKLYTSDEKQVHYSDREMRFVTGGPKPDTVADMQPLAVALKVITEMMYIPAYRHSLGGEEGRSKFFDIPIGRGFIEEWVTSSGSSNMLAKHVNAVMNDIKCLLNLSTFYVNINTEPYDLRINVDGRSIVLGEIGAGISQLLIVLLSVKLKNPSFCLIDEPELNLHPKLQTEFLRLLSSYTQCGVMFSTHSYGLARVFQTEGRMIGVSKESENSPPILHPYGHPDLYQLLYDEFGFSGLADIGSAVLLLVEGVNDVKVVKHWLSLIDPLHGTLVIPLGGSDFFGSRRTEEIQVFPRITSSCYCLIDRDGEDGSDVPGKGRESFLATCKKNEICACMTRKRAIENYFTESAIRKVFPHKPQIVQLDEYEKLTTSGKRPAKHWNKKKNVEIARWMTLTDLAGTDILEFLRCVTLRKKYVAEHDKTINFECVSSDGQ